MSFCVFFFTIFYFLLHTHTHTHRGMHYHIGGGRGCAFLFFMELNPPSGWASTWGNLFWSHTASIVHSSFQSRLSQAHNVSGCQYMVQHGGNMGMEIGIHKHGALGGGEWLRCLGVEWMMSWVGSEWGESDCVSVLCEYLCMSECFFVWMFHCMCVGF